MPRRRRSKSSQTPSAPSDAQVVVVCRGGDCGNRTKHPGFDHLEQLRTIRDGARQQGQGRVTVVTSKCLDACEQSNVIVVVPGPEGRSAGAGPTWVGTTHDGDTTADIVSWVDAGGPGVAPEPPLVEIRGFRPNRLNRHELEEETGLS